MQPLETNFTWRVDQMQKINLNPMVTEEKSLLSPQTKDLAVRYITGEYYKRIKDAGFRISELGLPEDCPPEVKHGKNAILTAEKSALDILPEELLAGSASNIQAVRHFIPGFLPAEESGIPNHSISHTTVDFGDAVRKGLKGLEKEIISRKEGDPDQHHQDFFLGLLDVIRAMRIWTKRYIAAYKEILADISQQQYHGNCSRLVKILERVPENPPETFAEAIQSFWSFFEFQRLCGNWSGLGRFDEILGPYLDADLAAGRITLEEARELVAHFWIKGAEWCWGLRKKNPRPEPDSGDAQNYQNIILSGIDAEGRHIENHVTFLVLDVIAELHISDYPVAVRVNRNTSDKLLQRIAAVQLLGGGIVSVYNEDTVLDGLVKSGFAPAEARRFTNDGCWEVIIPGHTNFTYVPYDIYYLFQQTLLETGGRVSYGELYDGFLAKVRELAESFKSTQANYGTFPEKKSPGDYPERQIKAADVVLSLLEPSCRESGCSYTLHGTKYVMRGFHLAGLPDVANSLYAIKKLVFEEKLVSLPKLLEILEADWSGYEDLRLRFANDLLYYGNDNQEADAVLQKVFADCAAAAGKNRKIHDIIVSVGVSTFGREIAWAEARLATPFGKHAHEYLAPNLAPTPGTDRSPLTAVVNSYCRMDFTATPNGCPLDLRLSADVRNIPDAEKMLAGILKSFVEQGGFYLQIDTVDPEMLKAAQKDPDRFPNLVVRISGWSARFATLEKKWQDMIINRTALGIA